MKKRIVSVLCFLMVLCAVCSVAYAASPEAQEAAGALYELGLFQGTGTDATGQPIFDLDRVPTRFEAVTMLVRILGKEQEALQGTWEVPFTDVVDWASPYVGYAYTHGLTTGTTTTTYSGNDSITATQYITLVLRALGYSEDEGDFTWNRAWVLSDKIGLTCGQYSEGTTLTRGDVAIISYAALCQKAKGTEVSLIQNLYLRGAVLPGQTLSGLLELYGGIAYYKEYPIPKAENVDLVIKQEKTTELAGAMYFVYSYPFDNEYEPKEVCELYCRLLELEGFEVKKDQDNGDIGLTYTANVPATGKTFSFGWSVLVVGQKWYFRITIPMEDVTISEDSYDTTFYLSESEVSLACGESITITATISPALSGASVEWEAFDSEIVSVSIVNDRLVNGNEVITAQITALQTGNTYVGATLMKNSDYSDSTLALCWVTVTTSSAPLSTVEKIKDYITEAVENEQNALYMCQAAMTASTAYYGKYYAERAQEYYRKIETATKAAIELCVDYANLSSLNVPLATIYGINVYGANYVITAGNYLEYVIETSTYAEAITEYYEDIINSLKVIISEY